MHVRGRLVAVWILWTAVPWRSDPNRDLPVSADAQRSGAPAFFFAAIVCSCCRQVCCANKRVLAQGVLAPVVDMAIVEVNKQALSGFWPSKILASDYTVHL